MALSHPNVAHLFFSFQDEASGRAAALILVGMYRGWADRRGFETHYEQEDLPNTPSGQPATISLSVEGPSAYTILHGEAGAHRICRIDPDDPEKRRVTTFVCVTLVDAVVSLPAAMGEDQTGPLRSYILHPYTRVTDHRSRTFVEDAQAVLDGDLDHFLELPKIANPV